jgi:hypothetical protein
MRMLSGGIESMMTAARKQKDKPRTFSLGDTGVQTMSRWLHFMSIQLAIFLHTFSTIRFKFWILILFWANGTCQDTLSQEAGTQQQTIAPSQQCHSRKKWRIVLDTSQMRIIPSLLFAPMLESENHKDNMLSGSFLNYQNICCPSLVLSKPSSAVL